MKRYLHKLLSALVAVSLVISLASGFAITAFADDPTTYEVTFDITPPEAALLAVVEVKDSTDADMPDVAGVYYLEAGEYSYTVTATGYDVAAGDFTVIDENIEIPVALTEEAPPPPVTEFNIALSAVPDAIWTVEIEVGGAPAAVAEEADTVTVTITKAHGNLLADLTGITVRDSAGNYIAVGLVDVITSDANGRFESGEYTFEMPADDVEIQLDFEYDGFEVWLRTKFSTGAETEQLVKSYTRLELLALAESTPQYYSGYQDATTVFSARADSAVLLTALLRDAGSAASFGSGNVLWAYSADGTNAQYSYAYIFNPHTINGGTNVGRNYFPQLLEGTASQKYRSAEPAFPMLVLDECRSTVSDSDVLGGTGSGQGSYVFAFGLNQTEGGDAALAIPIKSNIYKLIIEKDYVDPRAGLDDWQNTDSEGFVNIVDKSKIAANSAQMAASPVWNGAIDVSWFDPGAYEYYIGTPAQLAGLAALVNGLHNSTTYYVGDTDYIRVLKDSNNDSDGPMGQNLSTAEHYYGKYNFTGKTIYLTADINMGGSSQNYMPIGGQYLMVKNDSTTKIGSSFCGTFDGQGHTVSNIYCDRHCSTGNYGDGSSVGLIGRLGVHDGDPASWRPHEPTVRNVAVSGSIHGNRSVGGIVGKIGKTSANNGDGSRGGIIENCANFANVSNTDAKGCGGIIGAGWNGGLIKNCYNAGNISTTYGCPTGGISGSNEIIIENCFNVGNITAITDRYAMAIGTNNGGGSQISAYWLTGSAAGGGYYGAIGSTSYALEKTEEYMKSDEFVTLLNENAGKNVFSADFESASQRINRGFPILSWQGGRAVEEPQKETEDEQTIAEATVEDGVATVTLTDKYIEEMVAGLIAGKKTIWHISMDTQGESYSSAVLEMSAKSAALLAKSGITLVVDSDLAAVTISKEGLEQLGKSAGVDSISIKVEKGESGKYTFALMAGDKLVDKLAGGLLVLIRTEATAGTVSALIDSSGEEAIMRKSVTDSTGIRMRLGGSSHIRVYENDKKFKDVKSGAWFEGAVAFTSSRDLMGGGMADFLPQDNMTRAMLVTVLHRLEDLPDADMTSVFNDMTEGSWFFDAMLWAAENEIVFGVSETEAAPQADITREQLVVIIHRYVKHLGIAVSDAAAALDGYKDGDEVSDWAQEAFAWAVLTGIITGRSDDELAPGGTATRAEVATILWRTIMLLV